MAIQNANLSKHVFPASLAMTANGIFDSFFVGDDLAVAHRNVAMRACAEFAVMVTTMSVVPAWCRPSSKAMTSAPMR